MNFNNLFGICYHTSHQGGIDAIFES